MYPSQERPGGVMQRSLGVCVGSSTIKAVGLEWSDDEYRVVESVQERHDSEAVETLDRVLRQVDHQRYDFLTITGRRLKDHLDAPTITEPEATHYALGGVNGHDAIISAGSENLILYQLSDSGRIIQVQTGNKCASGTGEFFLQQIHRMGVDVETATRLAEGSEPYRVSGRCSVFCKSDCTHALNKGTPIGRVCAGLGDMIAEKIKELVRRVRRDRLIIVGGLTRNAYIMQRVRESVSKVTIPPHADVFEALGAAVYARTHRATHNGPVQRVAAASAFSRLAPLAHGRELVTFKQQHRRPASAGEECIVGLDVGSTTTKAVLLAAADNAMVASVYLRTDGNPVAASRACYAALLEALGETQVRVVGVGVTGSGRNIAGLHAQTDAVINEIIAHATGAAYFDPEVDTILEIGGQDAKYTYLHNGVPCDYAMNEACSAGTGSFIEEAAKETLHVHYLDIQEIALRGQAPPNFNDQCAAFISSDLKNATHENIAKPDIVAGLVYSICINYINRVKGQRRIGKRIFMQGGVCYNEAIPLAMALLLKKPIVVPPEPGLVGAFGVALETKSRLGTGLLPPGDYSLAALRDREVGYGRSFTCAGGRERCDRGCLVNRITVDGKTYPFGGACDRYYHRRSEQRIDVGALNYVRRRQDLVFAGREVPAAEIPVTARTVGIPRSFIVNSLLPLYHRFFSELGFRVVLSDGVDPAGVEAATASFCYSAQIAHGAFRNLLDKELDYIFVPHVQKQYVEKNRDPSYEGRSSCIIVQGEPYYLQSAFREVKPTLLTPVLNFENGWGAPVKEFVEVARRMGARPAEARRAFATAVEELEEMLRARRELGRRFMAALEADPSKFGVVLFGRSYNAFAAEANLGIPEKVASRGVMVVPFDCLEFADLDITKNMNWATGQDLMKASRLVSSHPQLYAIYVSNFSCGPDAFMVGYFRSIMGSKPSLTLEIDSHSADAGVNTRIEAFLDIIERVRMMQPPTPEVEPFRMPEMVARRPVPAVRLADGRELPLTDPRVRLVIPSMNTHTARLGAAVFRSSGIRTEAVPLPSFATLMEGRRHCSGKECLPLILTTGSLVEYLSQREDDEVTVYFMPTASGGCRFSQYSVFLENFVTRQRMPNVGILSLTTENNYGGFSAQMMLKTLKATMLSDVMDDVKNALSVLAVDSESALSDFSRLFGLLEDAIATDRPLSPVLDEVVEALCGIPLRCGIEEVPRVVIAGEIYVRKDEFSSQGIVERLARRNIVCMRSPFLEWFYYVDYFVKHLLGKPIGVRDRVELSAKQLIVPRWEHDIKRRFARTRLIMPHRINIAEMVRAGANFVNENLVGEPVLVAGSMFRGILHEHHGVVSAGPFGCMPSNIIESILSNETVVAGNHRIDSLPNADALKRYPALPFLSVECDGNPFPSLIESRLEAFALQVEELYGSLKPAPPEREARLATTSRSEGP